MLNQIFAKTILITFIVFHQFCLDLAAPSQSMTRIQEVLRTLMGSKPVSRDSRGVGFEFYDRPRNILNSWD
ncbi:unnamed protein product [Dracunculus medinensis]|uniref:Uncharacterized protein n=1 Tax=Dracunculus medinensis TaxID=318479 RepID=A0A0N4UIK4_DRAME|nr:unnamed protein product [Dracunculus medinensis]